MSTLNSKFNRRNVLKGTVALAAAPAIIGKASAQAKITWKVQSHWPKVSSSFTDSLGVLGTQLEEATDGRMKLETLGAGEIAKGGEIYNIVRRGVVEMGTISPAYILGEAQAMGLYMGVPGTLREPWEMMHLTRNLGLEDAVNAELRPKGAVLFADKAYPTEIVLKKEIKSAADLGSLKVRSAGNMLEYLAAAGAAPQQVAGPEIYQAISTGVVDGAHWGAAIGAQSMKFWEVAPYHYRPALLIANDAFIVNAAALDKLPADIKLIFQSLIRQRYFLRSVEYQHKEAIALNEGIAKMNVKVMQYPADVLEKFAGASKNILQKELDKGQTAAKIGDSLNKLMKDLGYV